MNWAALYPSARRLGLRKNFAPYVTKIMAAGAELVMSANWGPDLRLLLQQGAQLGWKVKLAGFFLNDPTLTQAVKDAAVGPVTTGIHMITVGTPENKALIEKWRAKFPEAPIFYRVPDLITGRGVNAWSWLFEVIRRRHGQRGAEFQRFAE